MIYGYARIFQKPYTGMTCDRAQYKKLKSLLKSGDTIIFDSVYRMSRNSSEGIEEYLKLMSKGINLIFLKEPYINTSVYLEQLDAYKT